MEVQVNSYKGQGNEGFSSWWPLLLLALIKLMAGHFLLSHWVRMYRKILALYYKKKNWWR